MFGERLLLQVMILTDKESGSFFSSNGILIFPHLFKILSKKWKLSDPHHLFVSSSGAFQSLQQKAQDNLPIKFLRLSRHRVLVKKIRIRFFMVKFLLHTLSQTTTGFSDRFQVNLENATQRELSMIYSINRQFAGLESLTHSAVGQKSRLLFAFI